MSAIFRPSADLMLKLALTLIALLALGLIALWWYWPRTDYAQHLGIAVPQPVPFSHQHHVAGLGLDCRFCHSSVEVSSNASLPATQVCMTCHSQIWTNAALLAPVRESFAHDEPIVWRRVADVPAYVYFDHSIHIAKGVGCQSCHGDVASMALTVKARPLTMEFCLSCHRDPGPQLRPRSAVFDTAWHRPPGSPSAAELLAQNHVPDRNLTECSLCHR